MKQAYSKPFIIVEGNLFNTQSAIEPAALMGALSYLTVMEGISVLHTHDASIGPKTITAITEVLFFGRMQMS